MIVVDANILVYRIVEGEMTAEAMRLQEKDPDWRTSPLWEYEFGNVLFLMIRHRHLTPKLAVHLFRSAQGLFAPGETHADLDISLRIAVENGISFYDAQYLALAQSLEVPLITEDKALRKAGGKSALSLRDFLN